MLPLHLPDFGVVWPKKSEPGSAIKQMCSSVMVFRRHLPVFVLEKVLVLSLRPSKNKESTCVTLCFSCISSLAFVRSRRTLLLSIISVGSLLLTCPKSRSSADAKAAAALSLISYLKKGPHQMIMCV